MADHTDSSLSRAPSTAPRRRSHPRADTQKEQVRARLRRIEGQVRGIERMVDEDRYCVDVLVQISAIQESLRKVGEVLLRDHLDHCVAGAIGSGDHARGAEISRELADLFTKYVR